MANVGKKSKKDSTFIRAKLSFTSPYTPKWSPLPQEDMHFILNTLKEKLVSIGLAKREVKGFHSCKKKKDKNAASTSEPVPELSQDPPLQDSPKNGWTDVAARKQLAIGINEVTKAVERNELKLLLVCKSVKPKHMTDHLIALSATRGVPACQVPRLSQSLSELLGLKSVLALGFRHCASQGDEVFTNTVEAITAKVPSLDVAWLQGGAQSVKPKDFVNPEEEEGEAERKGQKRKLESESELTESVSSGNLQPLQVKKIVANPAKKRKTKAKS
ncbi:ribonuclease P protein subunit p38 [Cheilinus undulatus]|uniref:ribonuclease P protein subunit p38 n=1 Tax=Cheilinus undulatus TaxID=241271 RepID=UPI001BD26FBE|nr:ribonuclease P protein subunit p38 [Cheilinus undulatus]